MLEALVVKLAEAKAALDAAEAAYDLLAEQVKAHCRENGTTEYSVSGVKVSLIETMRFDADKAASTLTGDALKAVVRFKPSVVRKDVDAAVAMGLITSALDVPHTFSTSLKVTAKK